MCIVQNLRFSGFSLYPLSFFLYSPFKTFSNWISILHQRWTPCNFYAELYVIFLTFLFLNFNFFLQYSLNSYMISDVIFWLFSISCSPFISCSYIFQSYFGIVRHIRIEDGAIDQPTQLLYWRMSNVLNLNHLLKSSKIFKFAINVFKHNLFHDDDLMIFRFHDAHIIGDDGRYKKTIAGTR